MESRKVSEKRFGIPRIWKTITKSSAFPDFPANWESLVRQLFPHPQSATFIAEKRPKLNNETTNIRNLASDILQSWLSLRAKDATIDALCIALEDSDLGDISDDLQKEFKITVIRPTELSEQASENALDNSASQHELDKDKKKPTASVTPQVRPKPQQPIPLENSNDEDGNQTRVERQSSYSYIS